VKIGISTSVIQRGRSGIAQYVFALVRALLRQDGEHELTLFVLEEDLPLFNFAAGRVKTVSVPERFRPPLKNIFWHQTVLPRLARENHLDVLHIPSYRRMLWRQPCALVATIHDLAPFHLNGKYSWSRMLYGRHVARWLAWRQNKIIAVSQHTCDDLRHFFDLPAENIRVIHNGLDHARFFPSSSDAARFEVQQTHDLRKPFFLYVARLEHPAKNHSRLIEAFNRFKALTNSDWQLVFAGSDWHGAEAIHAAIAQSPFRSDIRSLGFIPDDDLPTLYRAAEVFVYPSLYEGFGFPPLEAMACGCPVLCSTRGALGEIIGYAAATLDPEDVDDLKNQLVHLATEESLRANLREEGLERARHFDWERTASQTLDVYASVLKTEPAVARVRLARQTG
jgi:glycosyltransferase involved in cell wall biosynthesis